MTPANGGATADYYFYFTETNAPAMTNLKIKFPEEYTSTQLDDNNEISVAVTDLGDGCCKASVTGMTNPDAYTTTGTF